jgi:ABC-type uncharacterized transport system auxiliary subunit
MRNHWLFWLPVLLVAAGCIGPRQPELKIDYYTLEYAPPAFPGMAALPRVLRVQRFQIASDYNGQRIVFRQKAFQRDTYNYHKWRANPADLVSDFLTRDLNESGLFRAVFGPGTRTSATDRIEGSVDEFFEYDEPSTWQARLALTVTLIRENEPDITRRIVFQKRYVEIEPCQTKTPQALAEAMSRAMARASQNITQDVYRALEASR